MAGYICIPRSITNTWLWKNPEYFYWYSWLVMHAAYMPVTMSTGSKVITLKRGQLAESAYSLSRHWNKSYPTVKRFLKQLIMDNKISKEIVEGRVSIITIKNYSLSDELKHDVQVKTEDVSHFPDLPADPQKTPMMSPSMNDDMSHINNCVTDEYNVPLPRSDIPSGTSLGTPSDIQLHSPSDPHIINNKKIINKNLSTNTSTGACAHAHEYSYSARDAPETVPLGEVSEHDRLVLEELKNNESWLENICMRHHLASIDVARRYLEDFGLDIANFNRSHTDRQQLISHFNCWLYKVLSFENQKTEIKQPTASTQYGNRDDRKGDESPLQRRERIDREQIAIGMQAMAYFQQKRDGDPPDLW